MKDINNYIIEKLNLSKVAHKVAQSNKCKYFPKSKEELRKILEERLAEDKNADLNDIDVSEITDMGLVNNNNKIGLFEKLDPHNIDISEWDVSNVTNMCYMFYDCKNFNSDLSQWNVSKVEDMNHIFYHCEKFNSDLDNWDVSNVKNASYMFWNCKSLTNMPDWYW